MSNVLQALNCFQNFQSFLHSVKSVSIRSFPGPYFPVFGLKTVLFRKNIPIRKYDTGESKYSESIGQSGYNKLGKCNINIKI